MPEFASFRETRRDFLRQGGTLLGLTAMLGAGGLLGCAKEPKTPAVTATEALMQGHGVTQRLLLVFEELAVRLRYGKEFSLGTLTDALGLARRYLQDFHEKWEEERLFPRFAQAGKLVALTKHLQQQHQAGRRMVDYLLQQAGPAGVGNLAGRVRLAVYLELFSRWHRPHSAREDTVLFPFCRVVFSPQEFEDLGEICAAAEVKSFGPNGSGKIVEAVAHLEKALGLADLEKFTPGL